MKPLRASLFLVAAILITTSSSSAFVVVNHHNHHRPQVLATATATGGRVTAATTTLTIHQQQQHSFSSFKTHTTAALSSNTKKNNKLVLFLSDPQQPQEQQQQQQQQRQLPFWLDIGTKGGALVWSLVLFLVPIVVYNVATGLFGADEIQAGITIGVGFTVLATVAWVSTYIFRVATKDMTYVRTTMCVGGGCSRVVPSV